MELVHERSGVPMLIAVLLMLVLIFGSFGVGHLMYPTTADLNLFFWSMTRAAGLTSYGLLTLTVVLGSLTRSGVWDRWHLRYVVTQVHQYVSLLLVPFLALHLWAISQDGSVPFSLQQIFVPLASNYRPIPVAFGILSLYGVVILVLTSALRQRIGVPVWRVIHMLSFPLFVLVTCHGLLSGTDASTLWARGMYAVCGALFVLVALVRWGKRKGRTAVAAE